MFGALLAALISTSSPDAMARAQCDAILPFPAAMWLGSTTSGGGGGVSYNRLNDVGLTGIAGGGLTVAANSMVLVQVTTPSTGGQTSAICIRLGTGVAGSVNIKPVIYTDSGGNPGSLVATGNQFTTVSTGIEKDVSLPFGSPVALSGSTNYWIGFINSASLSQLRQVDGATHYRLYSNTYASGAPSSPGSGTNSTFAPTCYLILADSTTSATIGYVTNSTTFAGAAQIRLNLPANRFINDIAFLHATFINTSGGSTWTTPDGWTKIDEQNINFGNYRELLFYRRLDGTECWPDLLETGAGASELQLTISLWRGYLASGTPYEAYANAANNVDTAPHGNTISTLGVNRTVINFYSNDCANSTQVPGNANANGWADAYALLASIRCASTCSWKDVATASSVTQESRTFTSSDRWRCLTLALIKA